MSSKRALFATIAVLALCGCKSTEKKIEETTIKVTRCLDAVQEYMADPDSGHEGDCPKTLSVLVPVRVKSIEDGWGNKLKIKCKGINICVYSLGPNGKDDGGGGDDIQRCSGN